MKISSSESVTQWISNLKRGDPQAAQRLWQRYGNEEIAQLLGIGLRTVERRLSLIRQTWEETLRGE